jgi:Phage head-tail joining protein
MPKPFDIGRMRHQVIWQTNDSGAVDAMNQPLDVWTTVGTFWAEVIPFAINNVEAQNGRQAKSVTKGTIKMRNVGPIKPSDRFLFEDTG